MNRHTLSLGLALNVVAGCVGAASTTPEAKHVEVVNIEPANNNVRAASTESNTSDDDPAVDLNDVSITMLRACIRKRTAKQAEQIISKCLPEELEERTCRIGVENEIIASHQHIQACSEAHNADPSKISQFAIGDMRTFCLSQSENRETGENGIFAYEIPCENEIDLYRQCLRAQIKKNGIKCRESDVTSKLLIDV